MMQNNTLYFIIGCTMMLASCSQSSNNAQTTALAEDDRPPLEYSDADRTFDVVLEVTSDSLITCNNYFSGKDDNPLILDTSNPDFPDLFSKWFASMDSTQINRLKTGSELHISVRGDVTDATIIPPAFHLTRIDNSVRLYKVGEYSGYGNFMSFQHRRLL